MKMTFQEIRIIATGPCIANQLRDVNTICRRSWYIAAHVWKIYDFKIEVVPFIINFSTEGNFSNRKGKQFLLHMLYRSCYTSSDKSWMRIEPDCDYDKRNISMVSCETDIRLSMLTNNSKRALL